MARRLNVTLAVKRLVRDAAARLPELAHVDASKVLVVAGEARRASRATIKPVGGTRSRPAPFRIRTRGRDILYVITLRPLWFLDSTPEERITTVLHELWHASTRFDGSLHRGRRHATLPPGAFERRVRRLRDQYLAEAPAELVAPFAHQGLVRARMWLERPAAARRDGGPARRLYTEKQLFYGVVRMRSRAH
ncbi:MAG TPA: putative metallopeptidase [Anaeromyxobacteraceae bacterium]|nr:putative metallopeptidase [Anaeromyxobacteraceae bacterium]